MTYKESNPPIERCKICRTELTYHHTDGPVRIYTCTALGCPKKDTIIAVEARAGVSFGYPHESEVKKPRYPGSQ